MTITIKTKITGDKELEKKFNDRSRVKEPVAKYLDFFSRDVANHAKENSPVEQGFLQGSWTAEVQTNRNPMTATVSSDMFYAPILEFSGYQPRASGIIPFLRPAVDTVLKKLNNMNRKLGKDIEKEYKKK